MNRQLIHIPRYTCVHVDGMLRNAYEFTSPMHGIVVLTDASLSGLHTPLQFGDFEANGVMIDQEGYAWFVQLDYRDDSDYDIYVHEEVPNFKYN